MTDAPERGMIQVLIADDQRVVREGLSMLVALIDDVEVVGTACDGAEAGRLAEEHRPDVVLMDLRMPGMGGLELQHRLSRDGHRVPIIVLSAHAGEEARVRAMQAGAVAFLQKPFDNEMLLGTIESVRRR